MPVRYARKAQCIELCRGKNQNFAVQNIQTKKCHCLKNDPHLMSISSGTDSCAGKTYQVSIMKIFQIQSLISRDIFMCHF